MVTVNFTPQTIFKPRLYPLFLSINIANFKLCVEFLTVCVYFMLRIKLSNMKATFTEDKLKKFSEKKKTFIPLKFALFDFNTFITS